jgi:hypothetical protein
MGMIFLKLVLSSNINPQQKVKIITTERMTKTTRVKMIKNQIISQNMFQKKIIIKENTNNLLNLRLEIDIELILLLIMNSYFKNYFEYLF